jgi:dihydroorotase
VNPPLREDADLLALREALADGTIDCIATDHAPHGILDKNCELSEAAPGMIGLELCVPLILGLVEQQKLPLGRVVEALTRAPAKILALPTPAIREGGDASLVLVDPARTWTVEAARLRTKSKNTPFLGQTVKGMVMMTLVSGAVAFDATDAPR